MDGTWEELNTTEEAMKEIWTTGIAAETLADEAAEEEAAFAAEELEDEAAEKELLRDALELGELLTPELEDLTTGIVEGSSSSSTDEDDLTIAEEEVCAELVLTLEVTSSESSA